MAVEQWLTHEYPVIKDRFKKRGNNYSGRRDWCTKHSELSTKLLAQWHDTCDQEVRKAAQGKHNISHNKPWGSPAHDLLGKDKPADVY